MASADSSVSPFFANSSLNSNEMRYALAAAFADGPGGSGVTAETGVVPSSFTAAPGSLSSAGPFAPSSNGSSSAPSVSVTPGQCIIQTAAGGTYVCTLPAAATVALDLALPASGQSRIDVLCGRVLDTEADSSGTSNVFRLQTVTGTSSATPSVPSVPAGYLPLFNVTVNNAGSITAITSVRTWTRGVGGLRFVEPGDTRAGSYPTDLRIFATGQIDAWINGVWLNLVTPTAWTQTNANFNYLGAGSIPAGTVTPGSGGAATVAYKIAGKDLWVDYNLSMGTTGVGGGAGGISVTLPAGFVAARTAWVPCHVYVNAEPGFSSTAVDVSGMATIDSGSSTIRPLFPIGVIPSAGVDLREAQLQNSGSTGTRGTGVPMIPNSFPLVAGSGVHIGPGLIQVQ